MAWIRKGYIDWVLGACLGAAAFILYAGTAEFDSINYDDQRVLFQHPELYAAGSWKATARSILLDAYPREEPLLIRDLSWAMDARIFGFTNPRGYHVVNVLLHSLVVAVAFLWLRRLLGCHGALLAALLYAVLAIHVEPVAWIMGRKDLLCALFSLWCLLSIDETRSGPPARCIAWYLVAFACLALALFSKISAIALPFLLLLDAVFRPTSAEAPKVQAICRDAFALLPFFVLAFMVYHWYSGILMACGILDRHYTATAMQHLWNLLMIEPFVLAKYLRLLLTPWNLSLFYTTPDLQDTYPVWHVATAIVLFILLIVLAIVLPRISRRAAFTYLGTAVLMIPYSNLRYFGIWIANRYAYQASILVVALLLIAGLWVWQRWPRTWVRAGLLAAWAFCLGWNLRMNLTYQPVWRNSEALWHYELNLPATRIDAFQNFAALNYERGADRTAPVPDREQAWMELDSVVTKAESRFWKDRLRRPPAELAGLYFIKAIAAQVRGQSPETQLEWLRQSESLTPGYDAVLFELAVHYYRRAIHATDEAERTACATTSLDYYERYVASTMKDVRTLSEIGDWLKQYAIDFIALAPRVERIRGRLSR